MRAKLAEHGQRIFDTYELLEMLLYYVIPYKDTNPIAKRLLAEFGSLDGVMSATEEELSAVSGIGERAARFLALVGSLSEIIGGEMLPEDCTALDSYAKIGKFLTDLFGNEEESCVYILLLDNGLKLISAERLYSGYDYDSSAVRSESFVSAAAKSNAAFAITAHNHPHGPCYPTQGDRATDALVSQALGFAGIKHIEHFIVTGDRYIGISKTMIMSHPDVDIYSESNVTVASGMPFVQNRDERRALLSEIIAFSTKENASELADALFAKYYTIENLLGTDLYSLSAEIGESAALQLKLCAYICSRRKTDLLNFGTEISDADAVEYFKALYIGVSVETVYAMLFDNRGRVQKCELIGEGTVNASEILPKKILHTALRSGAVEVVVAHNHPSGVCEPSDEDLGFTAMLAEVLDYAKIKLRFHAVVAGQTAEIVNSKMHMQM
jgi:DNA repair protein RadC